MASRAVIVGLCLVVAISAFAGGFGTVALLTDSEVVTGTVSTEEPSEDDAVSQYEQSASDDGDDGEASDSGDEEDEQDGSDAHESGDEESDPDEDA